MQIDKIGIVECCDSFWLLNFVLLIGVLRGGKRGVALITLMRRCLNYVNKEDFLVNVPLGGSDLY